jgi:hypothetical protein
MRQSAQQIELDLDPPQDLLGWYKELDISETPEVPNCGAAKVANERDARDEDRGEEEENEWGGPGGDFVGADAVED